MTKTSVVLVTTTPDYPVDLGPVHEVLDPVAEVRTYPLPWRPATPEEAGAFTQALAEADALFVRPGIITRAMIEEAPRLRVIAVHGSGVDQVDVGAATGRGILVTNAPAGPAISVAELTLALMLRLVRPFQQAADLVRQDRWSEARLMGGELCGQTLGLVGFGMIARLVAGRAAAFDMRILATDPYVAPEVIRAGGAEPRPLGTLLGEADFISVHTPLLAETHHLIGEAEFAAMKPTAFFLNLSRGPVVDESALVRALRERRIAGAAVDVLEEEPPRGRNPLFEIDTCLVTPHLGAATWPCLARTARYMAEDIARVLRGERPVNLVNPAALGAAGGFQISD